MPRLTVPPNLIGTSEINTLVGEELDASTAIGIDILNPGVISTLSENDIITGTATGTGIFKPSKAGTGIGIHNSGILDAGDGSDAIAGTGTGGFRIFKLIDILTSKSSSLNAVSKDNTITVTDIAGNLGNQNSGSGIGISNSGTLNAGNGNDTITGTGTITVGTNISNNTLKNRKGESGIGISNSGSFDVGNGDDKITGTGTGGIGNIGGFRGGDDSKGGDGGTGTGISNSGSFDAGDGDDTITGIGTGGTGGEGGSYASTGETTIREKSGNGGTGTGINNSATLKTGDGNDTISGTGTGGTGGEGSTGGTEGKNGDGGTGIGISNSGQLNTGRGEDTLIGTGTNGSSGKYRISSTFLQTISATSIDDSQNTNIEDTTIITAGSKSSIGTTIIGIQNIKKAIITTGENKDTIKGSANSLSANTLVYGIFNDGTIDTGDDYDILTGQAVTTLGGTAYGIYGKGTINTGNANDKVTASSKIDKVEQKVNIGGGIHFYLGAGDDYFKGFGKAIVNGGKGFDILDLSAFKRASVTVSGVVSSNPDEVANITFKDNGNSITLLTTGFEKFVFADSSLGYSNLI